ncbi:PH domain-containing protein [Cryptosporangium aurantiacum]|uniref:PH domain-containing protein n=1 Tax=Cryptosporangium aurantiacum TaxID=134849 RepID=A0A1M7QP50_9ACTN|nr:PH domain-containing protein [Cryptosporangium aurantiacum]SHN33271.1 PH domain-containing protein [Cryptosporangium aurantiacum]
MAADDPGTGSSPERDLGRRTLHDPPPVGLGITPVPTDDDPPGPPPPPSPDPTAGRPPPPAPPTAAPAPPPPPRPYRPILEPTRHVAQYLFDSERYCGEWRRHWIHVIRWLLALAGGTLLLGYIVGAMQNVPYVVGAVTLLWIALLIAAGYKIGDWYFDKFVLTDKRVMLIEGIVTRKVAMMPLARVTDMAYQQSPLGRVLNYGTFVLESAGQDQALREIAPLPYPNQLYLLFCQVMYDPEEMLAVGDEGD